MHSLESLIPVLLKMTAPLIARLVAAVGRLLILTGNLLVSCSGGKGGPRLRRYSKKPGKSTHLVAKLRN